MRKHSLRRIEMVKYNSGSDTSRADREYIKQEMKAIKKAKKDGDDAKAERIAHDLYRWLGWE